MNRSLRICVAAVAGSAVVLLAAPANAQVVQATRCFARYQDQVIYSYMEPVVVYEEPETVTLYPGNAVAPVTRLAGATVGYVNCVLAGT